MINKATDMNNFSKRVVESYYNYVKHLEKEDFMTFKKFIQKEYISGSNKKYNIFLIHFRI